MTAISMITTGLFLSGCMTKEAPSSKPTSITVGTLAIADSLPLYVAEKEGLFQKENIAVSVQAFKSSQEEAQAFSAGELQYMMNDMIVASLLKKGGTPITSVAMAQGASPSEGRFMVVASPQSGLTSMQELNGKKVAISKNTMMEYLMDRYAEESNMDPNNMQYINMPNLLLRLESVLDGKDIDAAILPDPLASLAAKKGATVLLDDTQLPANISQSVILGNSDWVQSHPKEAASFLKAYNAAIELINKDPEKYRPLLLSVARIPEPMANTYPMPHFTAHANITEPELNKIEAWLVTKGLLQKPYSYTDLVDTKS